MGSYRPFPPPPQSTFGPPPPAPPPPGGAAPPPPNWGYNVNFPTQHYNHPSRSHPQPPPPPPPPPQQYSYPPPPPQQQSQMYYPTSQYTQYNQNPVPPTQPPPPPPPPSSPPPSSLIPPPPPPSSLIPPPPPPSSLIPPPPPPARPPSPPPPPSLAPSTNRAKEHRTERLSRSVPPKQHKPPVPLKGNGPHGRVETEEERKLRKKKEFEKQRQEEKRRQQLKQSAEKAKVSSSGAKGHGSISGRPTPLLSGDRIENRLKKPTTFICKLKFRNALPDLKEQPKLLPLKRDKDRNTRYKITSLEKMHKPQLYVEQDLGIPLDLLDLSVYNPPKGERMLFDPEDEELLRDDDPITPIKNDGLKRKDRPTDKGMSWLVKTQYISPLNTEAAKQSLTDKHAKERLEARNSLLEDFNNRERRIRDIEASFKACRSRPVHATNKALQPVEIFPLLPDFDRLEEQFAIATFDSAPTADAEAYSKLDKSIRDTIESRAVMKGYTTTGADSSKPEKFLAYMAPAPEELSKDIYDENEDVSYTWVREYHWDVRGDDGDPTTYLVAFDESEARYLPLPTKLILRKKKAKEGKSTDEVEHFPAPASITVRRRSTVASIELKETEDYGASSQRGKDEDDNEDDDMERDNDVDMQDQEDQSSEGEPEYMSEN